MEEIEELHSLSTNLCSLSHLNSNLHRQISRLTWLKERGAKSKFFYGIMSSRRMSNDFITITINNTQLKGVENVGSVFFIILRLVMLIGLRWII